MNIYLQAILVVGILSLFKKVRKRWYVIPCATGSKQTLYAFFYMITIQFDYLDQIRYPDLSSNKLIWYGRSFEMVKNLRNR